MHLTRNVGLLAFALLLSAPAAFADRAPLTIEVDGFGDWGAAIASLQHDLGSEGRTLSVRVRGPSGHMAVCGSYVLSLDIAGARALEIGACDPGTDATSVRLVHRDALFGAGAFVPVPLQPAISATFTASTTTDGGATSSGDSDVHCNLDLHPYLDDLQHGTRIYLTPDRFQIRVIDSTVTAIPRATGWSLSGPRRADLTVSYEVVETQTGNVVIQQQASLSCGTDSAAADTTEVSFTRSTPARTSEFMAPTLARPHWTVSGDLRLASAGYALLGGSRFQIGQAVLSGSDFAASGAFMIGVGSLGITVDLHGLLLSMQPQWYVSDHFAVAQLESIAGASIPVGNAFLRLGPECTVSYAAVFGFPGGSGTTNAQVSGGWWSQVVFRSRTRPRRGSGVTFIDSGLGVTVPVFGPGVFALTWTESWGSGW